MMFNPATETRLRSTGVTAVVNPSLAASRNRYSKRGTRPDLAGERDLAYCAGGSGDRRVLSGAGQRRDNRQVASGFLGDAACNGGYIKIIAQQVEFAVAVQHGRQHGDTAVIHAIDGSSWRRQHGVGDQCLHFDGQRR